MTRESTSPTKNQARDGTSHRVLWLILLYALVVRLIFVFLTPAWQAPDEYPHFWYANALSQSLQFPAVSSEFPGYEAFQPPLYYAIIAVILRALPDAQPCSFDLFVAPGFTLIVLRVVSVFLGVLTTWFAYVAARQIRGVSKEMPLIAAMFVATLPTFVGLTSWVNNDSLVTALGSACAVYVFRPSCTPRTMALAGILAGLAFLAKSSAVILLPLIFITVAVRETDRKRAAKLILLACVCWLPGVVLAAAKNLSLTGSILVLNTQVEPQWNLSLDSLVWSLRNLTWSFWLAFGRTYRIALPPSVYVLTIVPLTVGAAYGLWRVRKEFRADVIILLSGIALALLASLYYSLSYPPRTMTSWGKNLYPVLTLFAVFFAVGWEHTLRGKALFMYTGLVLMAAGCGWAAYQIALL